MTGQEFSGEGSALVVGEALIDVVHAPGVEAVERPGGSAVNAAVALARLGRPVRLATSFAPDSHGRVLSAHLADARVVLAADPFVLPRTSRADARIGPAGAASYSFDVGWRMPHVVATAGTRVVHVVSLGPLLDPGAEEVLALVDRLRPEATVTYDVNVRPALTGAGPAVVERVRRMAARADLVKASDEDLLALWPQQDPGESAARLLELGPEAVVVTHGANGASWHVRSADGWSTGGVHAEPVDVVDTIGAGDTFGAALLDHLWPRLGDGGRERLEAMSVDDWAAALVYAARAAAVTVSRVGADPPTRDDLEAR
ncbi:PfkB family carbohydrate kinase [Nocardioides sp. SYSU DS0651]|uniref:PfkB family carbohydrate kinase n=1 Tax=Nocardioides sp. SYSU DS0651 TaxID=3415955 RepID=UPI003F4B01BD